MVILRIVGRTADMTISSSTGSILIGTETEATAAEFVTMPSFEGVTRLTDDTAPVIRSRPCQLTTTSTLTTVLGLMEMDSS